MASKFVNLSPRDRRSAQAYLNGYNSRVRAWDRQAALLPQNGGVSLLPYIGFSASALTEFTTVKQFRAAIEARLFEIDIKVQAQKQRAAMSPGGHGRGMSYGQYVWMLTVYNHGQGARFMGYSAEEIEPSIEITDIEDWI